MGIISLLVWILDSCSVKQLLLMAFSTTFMSSTSLPVRNESGVTEFFEKYGYPRESATHHSKAALQSEDALTQSLERFTDIKQTGKMDSVTQKTMNTQRCDVQNKSNHSILIRRKRYALQGSKWSRSPITFRVSKYSKRIPDRLKIDGVVVKALKMWSEVSSLKFEEKNRGRVDIDIRFEVGDHGDSTAFNGSAGILAHAFFPQFGGDVHFDDDENWAIDERKGANLLYVATHEFGHALGLLHSEERMALMYPYTSAEESDLVVKLQPDDISAIQEIYGPPDNPVIDEPGTIPDTSDAPDMCNDARIDAATRIRNGDTYFFRGDFYWKIRPDTFVSGYPRRIVDDWDGLEGYLDAALTWPGGKTYFFKGSNYWRFTNMRMDLGYPKPISVGFEGIPEAPDAAFVWSGNGHTYFFKGNRYWLFDSNKDPPVSEQYPKLIKNWKGLPNDIEAAMNWENGLTYFFKGKKFYRFDDEKFKVETADPPYPRYISKWWFNCTPIS